MIVSEEDYLAHYGVKGMKWGVRKDRKATRRPRVTKTKDTYAIKDNKGNIVSKLKFYDYNIKNFDWVLVADVDTKKEHRGKGYATELLNSLYKDITRDTNKGLYMFVKDDNKRALSLYSKLEFEKIKKYRLDDGYYVIMAKGEADKSQFDKMNFA